MPPTLATTGPGRTRRIVVRFRGDDDGATAVEFGLIAVPFFALMWSIIETAMAFWAQQVLETAVAAAARQLYTNQFATTYATAAAQYTAQNKTPPTQQEYFKTLICNNVTGLLNCSKLDIDVRAIHTGQFTDAQASFAIPITNGVYDPSSYAYSPPGANEICVVRASLEYPKFTSIGSPTTVLRNGNRLILAAFTFRAEPF